jgi:hypothetical protein
VAVVGADAGAVAVGADAGVWYTLDEDGVVTTGAPGEWMLGTGVLTVGSWDGTALGAMSWAAQAGLAMARTTNILKMQRMVVFSLVTRSSVVAHTLW